MNKMIFIKSVAVMALFWSSQSCLSQNKTSFWPVKSKSFYQGFELNIQGEVLDFLPGLAKGEKALLTRATKDSKPLEFQSSIIPTNYSEEYVSLVWSTAISQAKQAPAAGFVLRINNDEYFTFHSHKDSLSAAWVMQAKGAELAFVPTEFTKGTQDAFGYMFLNIPTKSIVKGERITLSISGGDQNSMDWYMPFSVPVKDATSILAEPALVKVDDKLKQRIRVEVKHAGDVSAIHLKLDKKIVVSSTLKPGKRIFYILHEPVETSTTMELEIDIAGKNKIKQNVPVKPVRKFEVFFLPHSHVDIGFTHTQDEVEKLQWRNFEKAIELAERTKDYPDGSQFKWNAEITWAVEGYLKAATEEKKKKFINAIKNNWIGIDAVYASQLTGLQREEEMINNQRYALKLEEQLGMKITTAMSSDVPGYSWGTVESLAQTGVKYFSSGPNHMPHLPHGGYQVGHTFDVWGDVPFYWESASGKQKILFWMTSHGYSWFHDWSIDILSKAGSDPILKFLSELDEQHYPYDLVQLRYTVGNDNGPPDETMPDFIKKWNETYAYPKLRIATTLEMMEALEKRYAAQLPVHRGDFTPYWEDGALSSALETGLNRKTADKLVQAETLWPMLTPSKDSLALFDEAWRKVVLFSEHTWGANISKSQPDSEFTKELWRVKQSFAIEADKEATLLVDKALQSIASKDSKIEAVQILNTTSWNRTELVTLPAQWKLSGHKIKDESGTMVNSQLLSNGDLVFVAHNVPAFGSKKFFIQKGEPAQKTSNAPSSETGISNGRISLTLDSTTGDISSLTFQNGQNLISAKDTLGFNTYWYGGLIKSNLRRQGVSNITMTEKGNVLTKLTVTSDAPGANSLTREIHVVNGIDAVYLTNVVDKKRVLEVENVRFSFPFNIPSGQIRMDIPWATIQPETGQLQGANKNFYSVQRWVDLSNDSMGITLATLHAPIMEIGDMHGQEWMADMTVEPWINKYKPSNTLFSWVMNNTWFVNYKASQEGKIPFQYVLRPHGKFNDIETKKFGIEQTQPLLVVPVQKNGKAITPILKLENEKNVLVTSLKKSRDGKALMIRFFNPTDAKGQATINWEEKVPTGIYGSSPREEKGEKVTSTLSLAPWEVKTLRVEL